MTGVPGFDRQVSERLRMGAVEYGQQSYRRPLGELLAELLEECADIGGWGRIAAEVLERRTDLEPCEVDAIAAALRAAEVLAAAVWRQLDDAQFIVGEADREAVA